MYRHGRRAVSLDAYEPGLTNPGRPGLRQRSVRAAGNRELVHLRCGLPTASHADPQGYSVCSNVYLDQLGSGRYARRPVAKVRWRHQCKLDPTRSGRIRGAEAVSPREYSVIHLPGSIRAGDASKSYRYRTEAHAADTPTVSSPKNEQNPGQCRPVTDPWSTTFRRRRGYRKGFVA